MSRPRLSLKERIIETIEQARKAGATDDELDRVLLAIGCTRVVHSGDSLIVYYVDDGQERFIVIGPDRTARRG